jgi:hypothetical protein
VARAIAWSPSHEGVAPNAAAGAPFASAGALGSLVSSGSTAQARLTASESPFPAFGPTEGARSPASAETVATARARSALFAEPAASPSGDLPAAAAMVVGGPLSSPPLLDQAPWVAPAVAPSVAVDPQLRAAGASAAEHSVVELARPRPRPPATERALLDVLAAADALAALLDEEADLRGLAR